MTPGSLKFLAVGLHVGRRHETRCKGFPPKQHENGVLVQSFPIKNAGNTYPFVLGPFWNVTNISQDFSFSSILRPMPIPIPLKRLVVAWVSLAMLDS